MTFGFGSDAGYILWEGFKVEEGQGGKFLGALIFILLLAFLTEGLSFMMWYQNAKRGNTEKAGVGSKILNSVIYCFLRLLNYCQMLVAMTFNFWLIANIALFQFFAWFVFQEIKDGMIICKA